jgi:hypothetical protein
MFRVSFNIVLMKARGRDAAQDRLRVRVGPLLYAFV